MSFNAIREKKILAKISESTVYNLLLPTRSVWNIIVPVSYDFEIYKKKNRLHRHLRYDHTKAKVSDLC